MRRHVSAYFFKIVVVADVVADVAREGAHLQALLINRYVVVALVLGGVALALVAVGVLVALADALVLVLVDDAMRHVDALVLADDLALVDVLVLVALVDVEVDTLALALVDVDALVLVLVRRPSSPCCRQCRSGTESPPHWYD